MADIEPIEKIWGRVNAAELPEDNNMWVLEIEQIDIRMWSVYAHRAGEFAGRVEDTSVSNAVSRLVRQIKSGLIKKAKDSK